MLRRHWWAASVRTNCTPCQLPEDLRAWRIRNRTPPARKAS